MIYTYGADYERRKAVLNANGATVYTRLYFGDYEMTTRNGVNQYVHYITGGDGICAIGVKDGNSAFNFYVPYSDHLGSILTVTNTNGNIVAEQNFDAWGRKRNATTWDYANVGTNPTWLYRGYTGHEHLPEFNLINMNARLYDPVLGRMLSPDNLVSMGGSQGMNRYTYAYNNPMKYADLDGNCPMCIGAAIGAGIDIAIQWYTKGSVDWTQVGLAAISGAVGGGVGAWVGGSAALATSSAVVQGAISGAAAGAASGLVSGFMNGQRGWDLAKTVGISAGVGAVVGASTAYIKGRLFPPKNKAGIPAPKDPASSIEPNPTSGRKTSVIWGKMEGQMPEINPETGLHTRITYTPESVSSAAGGGTFDVVNAFSNAVSSFKGGLLTNAGRAATKHPQYFGFESTEALMQVYRSPQAINNLAASKLETLLGQGTMTTGVGGRYPNGWVTFTLPSGEAASWHLDGIFIGFRGSL